MADKENTSSVEKLAQDWKLRIRDWNLNARLPYGTKLADGKTVTDTTLSHTDHGKNFGELGLLNFRMTIRDVKKEHPEACFLAVFEQPDRDIVFYRTEIGTSGNEADKRATEKGDCLVYFSFERGEGVKFVDGVISNPDLPDTLLGLEFPIIKSPEMNLKKWKELIYLPQELSFKERAIQIKVLAKKQGD